MELQPISEIAAVCTVLHRSLLTPITEQVIPVLLYQHVMFVLGLKQNETPKLEALEGSFAFAHHQ